MVNSHRARRLAAFLLLSSIALFSGCVVRRYTVRTDPPGALVIVNDEALGPAPASRSFEYYGDRRVTLLLDGYEPQTIIQPINAPWWDNYATEFFTENLIPWVIRDDREYTYKLGPAKYATEEAVRDRADSMRSEAQILPEPRRGGSSGGLDSRLAIPLRRCHHAQVVNRSRFGLVRGEARKLGSLPDLERAQSRWM